MSKKKKIIIIISSVILSIVLLLAIMIPVININNVKKEKAKDLKSINSIIKVIEKNCEKELVSDLDLIMTSKYIIEDKKLYTSVESEHKVQSDLKIGEYIPDSGVIELDKECNISLSVIYGNYSIIKKFDNEAKIVEHSIYQDGSIIYFNPETNNICDNYVDKNSNDGVKNGCMKWYTFNDVKKNNMLKLILDHNTNSNVSWIKETDYFNSASDTDYSNKKGSITALEQLNTDTSTWKVKAKLISIDEISTIVDEKIHLDSEENFFFDSKESKPLKECYKGNTNKCSYSWLTDRTSINCTQYGCLNNATTETYGYWTSSASVNDFSKAWRVYFDGRVMQTNINDISSGIRPVIEIQKSLLK